MRNHGAVYCIAQFLELELTDYPINLIPAGQQTIYVETPEKALETLRKIFEHRIVPVQVLESEDSDD